MDDQSEIDKKIRQALQRQATETSGPFLSRQSGILRLEQKRRYLQTVCRLLFGKM